MLRKRNCVSVQVLDFVGIFTNTQVLLLHFCLYPCRAEMTQEQKRRYSFEPPFMFHLWHLLSQVTELFFSHQIGTKQWFPWKSGTSVFSKVLLLLTRRRAANIVAVAVRQFIWDESLNSGLQPFLKSYPLPLHVSRAIGFMEQLIPDRCWQLELRECDTKLQQMY